MGTSRIKIIDLSSGDQQVKTSRKRAEHGLQPDDLKKISRKVKKTPARAEDQAIKLEEQEEDQTASSELVEEKTKTKSQKKSKPVQKTRSKRYIMSVNSFDKTKLYPLKEAVELVKKTANTKFDSTIEAHLVLTTQTQGTLVLPHSLGKKRVILIFADKVEVQEGVILGDDKTITDIKEGKLIPGKDFHVVYAQSQYMPKLAQVAKTLGPKGLMPNPKNHTIIDDPKKAIKAVSEGSLTFKSEANAPVVHLAIGKSSQTEKQLEENVQTLITTIGSPKIEKIYLSSTMGPSIKIDPRVSS